MDCTSTQDYNGGLDTTPAEDRIEVKECRPQSYDSRGRSSFTVLTYKQDRKTLLQRRVYEESSYTSFGSSYGFFTNMGIVAPPTFPIHGYVFEAGEWIPHASPG